MLWTPLESAGIGKYLKIFSRRGNWANSAPASSIRSEVRRLIYTTNAIEGFNRQLRKVT